MKNDTEPAAFGGQPVKIESGEFATGPVPEMHSMAWPRVAMVAAMVAFSLPTYLTGVEIYGATETGRALAPILAGGALLTLIGGLCGAIGARTRLSSYMLVRIAFGERGAALVNLAFALSLLGWFGVNIDLFGEALARLLHAVLGISGSRWLLELGAGAVMTLTTVYGFRAINRLSALLVPVMMVVTGLMLYTVLGDEPAAADAPLLLPDGALSFGDAMSSVVGVVIVGAIILPDITRFIRYWPGAMYTAFLSYFVVGSLVMAAGGLAATAMGNDDLLDVMTGLGLGWSAFVLVIAGSWVLNSLNLYSTVLSVEATVPGLASRSTLHSKQRSRLLTVALGVSGSLAAFLNILNHFLDFLFYLAIVFVPVAGVIIVDYLFVRRAAYHQSDSSSVAALGARRLSSSALAAWGLGAAVALLGSESVIMLSGIAAIDAMLVSAAAYTLLSRFSFFYVQERDT